MQLRIPRQKPQMMLSLFRWFREEAPFAAEEFVSLLESSKNGIEINVEPLIYEHTRRQENYYRKCCREFADYCGMTPDEMHEEMLCIAFGSEEVTTKFGPRRRPLKRSRDAKVTEYSVLVDTLIRVAAEMGFDIPPPN